MVRLSSFLIFFSIIHYAIPVINSSCYYCKKKQFFELFEPRIFLSDKIRHKTKLYSRPLLIPSSPEVDEINATTDRCGTTSLLDIEPPPTLSPELNDSVNDTTNNENISTPVANLSSQESEPPIASFEEWTKQKLEQEKLKHQSMTNGKNVDHLTPSIDKTAASTIEMVSIEEKVQATRVVQTIPLVVSKRNYASKECGAKVIGANDEAEKYGAILNDKEKDEYMRNPCEKAKEKFIVIELCETIQPKSIELANFELFSSSPKHFRILGSDRQPPVEWTTLGEFDADDTREIQSFQIPDHNIYTKFLRLELISHFGKEHYCTLSSFRVYGISMVDEYEAESIAFGVVENAGAPIIQSFSDSKLIDALPAEPLITSPLSFVVTEPPLSTTLQTPSFNTVQPDSKLLPPMIPWQIQDCQQCDSKHRKAVTAWLCYVFSPSICSKRNIKVVRTLAPALSKGQIKFLNNILHTPLTCPYLNASNEKRVEEKLTVVLPSKQEPLIVQTIETEVKKQTIIQQKQTSNMPLPAGTTSHKESVFLKLNKRLSLLEMNISLSSQYLAELSRQYVAQTEEYRKNQEKTSKYIEEAISRASVTLSKQFTHELLELKKEMIYLFSRSPPHSSSSNVIHGRYDEDKHERGSMIVRYPSKENCKSPDFDKIYLDESDGLWTTQQLVVVIAVMQVTTFGMIFVLQYLWRNNAQASQKVILISSDLDIRKIIAAEVQNEIKVQQQPLINTVCNENSE